MGRGYIQPAGNVHSQHEREELCSQRLNDGQLAERGARDCGRVHLALRRIGQWPHGCGTFLRIRGVVTGLAWLGHVGTGGHLVVGPAVRFARRHRGALGRFGWSHGHAVGQHCRCGEQRRDTGRRRGNDVARLGTGHPGAVEVFAIDDGYGCGLPAGTIQRRDHRRPAHHGVQWHAGTRGCVVVDWHFAGGRAIRDAGLVGAVWLGRGVYHVGRGVHGKYIDSLVDGESEAHAGFKRVGKKPGF